MNSLSILLQAGAGSGGMLSTVLMMGGIIIVFYFFMIRPQQKKQKKLQQEREALTIGDKVITAGGIHGKIKEVGDRYFILEIADNVKIKIDKTSVFKIEEAPVAAK